jgi:hypothetical protein
MIDAALLRSERRPEMPAESPPSSRAGFGQVA